MAEPTLNADVAKGGSGKETYGQILSQAREAKGLSVDQVASQLRLAPKQIVGLEASDPSVFGSTVYTRAHIRSYARLLGVEEAKLMNVFNNSLSKEERDLQSFIRKTTQSLRPYKEETTKNGKARGLGWLLFLIVLGLVGYLGWDYLESNFDMDEIKAKVVSMVPSLSSDESKPKEASGTPTAAAVQTSNETTQAADPSNAAPATGEAGQTPADPNASAPAASGTQSTDPAMATLGRTPEERALEDKVVAEQTQQQQAEQQAAAAAQTPAPETPQNTQPLQLTQGAQGFEAVMNVPSEEVTTKFSASEGECWFGIYQGGKLVSNVTLRDGQSREFTHKLPFRITVGNHFRGKVDLDGRPVELSQGARSGSISFLVRAQ